MKKVIVGHEPVEYIHWNDINELVERLRLLVS